MSSSLPIDAVLPVLLDAVRHHACVVLSAAPGAGKTTRVPLALLQDGAVEGRIIMLEPRRLAAVRAAQYMAQLSGERVGQTVGYRIRGEHRIASQTRIEVVTEGILVSMIQQDPELTGVSLIIFDEFHERSLAADLGLALARDVQKHWREDLKILVMSATLDGVAVAALLDHAPVISSEGRSYPVTLIYSGRDNQTPLEQRVAQIVLQALQEQQGDVLVFLPGQREIRRTQMLLEAQTTATPVAVHGLYGEASAAQQQAALQLDPHGRRKIILATSIAETSLTIDGVSVVVDAGLVRTLRFDPRRGMSGMVTIPVSQATATQRAGRAGRQRAGVCYRLWHEEQHAALAAYPVPEILQSDLMPLALELAAWGSDDAALAFLDAPPPAHLQQARTVLQKLGALDDALRITAHGRAMVALPVHPRFAHMLLRAREQGLGALACDVAALLEERDLLRGSGERDISLHARWQALQYGGAVDRAARERVRQQIARLQQSLGITDTSIGTEEKLGVMLALCYPERIARRRDARGERWQLASGTGAVLPAGSALAQQEWLAIADVDGSGQDARIFLAEALTASEIENYFPALFFSGREVQWSPQEEAVTVREVKRFGAIVFHAKPLPARGTEVVAALCSGLRSLGWTALPLPAAAQQWLQRVHWVQQQQLLEALPDFSTEALMHTLEDWLGNFLVDVSRRSQLTQIDWLSALQARVDYTQLQHIERLAPAFWTAPTGSRIALDYRGEQPVLAVRLQEMFGVTETPCIASGKMPVLIHLLSPRQTPLAVTQDLSSFWQHAYKDVRKDMRGQYPKHYWPENPLEAEPTRRSKAADDRAKKQQR